MRSKSHASSPQKTKKPLKQKFKLDPKIIKRTLLFAVVIAIIFGGLELGRRAGYWGEPDALRTIRAEKIASKTLLGLELIGQDETGKKSLFMIESTFPSIERTFKPKGGNTEVTLREVIEYAENDGWKYDESISSKETWRARKYQNSIEMIVRIGGFEGNIVVGISSYERE